MYPVMLDVRNRRVLVVGAGPVDTQKARRLRDQGALVRVVAPQRLEAIEGVEWVTRTFEPEDIDDAWLVIAATGDPSVQQQIYDECTARRIWINCADEPDRCAFILPAVHREGPIVISVSTGGASPAFATWLRDRLRLALPTNVVAVAEELRRRRAFVKAEGRSTEDTDWTRQIDELVDNHHPANASG